MVDQSDHARSVNLVMLEYTDIEPVGLHGPCVPHRSVNRSDSWVVCSTHPTDSDRVTVSELAIVPPSRESSAGAAAAQAFSDFPGAPPVIQSFTSAESDGLGTGAVQSEWDDPIRGAFAESAVVRTDDAPQPTQQWHSSLAWMRRLSKCIRRATLR